MQDATVQDSRDEGFTLVETVAALGIVLVTMLGLLGTGLYAARSVVVGRQAQQAADVLNAEIEALRSLDYASLTMVSTDPGLATDARITPVVGVPHYDPGTGAGAERLDVRTVGAVDQHSRTVSTPNGDYTVRRYITIPAGTPVDATGMPSTRRVTVEMEWTTRGVLRQRRSSTLLTNTRRGLPLPFYTFQYNGPAPLNGVTPTWTVNPGNGVSFGFLVRNQGARDAFTLAASTPGWTFYRDADGDGLWSGDLLTEPALLSSRTDLLEPAATPFTVVAHATAGSSAGSTTTTFTATSVAQPSHPARSVAGVVVVTTGSVAPPAPPAATLPGGATCTPGPSTAVVDSGAASGASAPAAYTLSQVRLLNGPAFGDTAAQASLVMSKDLAGVQAQPCNWSTDLHSTAAGRYLDISGTATATRVRWVFDPASNAERDWSGTAKVVLHVQCPASATPLLTVTLGTSSGGTPTAAATGSATPVGCDPAHFERVDVTVTLPASVKATGQKTYFLDVTSDQPVRLLYGTSAAQSRLVVGMK